MTETTPGPSSDLRYPIGRYVPPGEITPAIRMRWMKDLEQLPGELRQEVADLDEAQLKTPYRAGGWTVRQVVHHIADSHLNSYMRFRLALTEDEPLIKAYQEDRWAELADAKTSSVMPSLLLLDGLHDRWLALLRALSEEEFARVFRHPEWGKIRLDWTLGMYSWHGQHHLAQITGLKKRMAC